MSNIIDNKHFFSNTNNYYILNNYYLLKRTKILVNVLVIFISTNLKFNNLLLHKYAVKDSSFSIRQNKNTTINFFHYGLSMIRDTNVSSSRSPYKNREKNKNNYSLNR